MQLHRRLSFSLRAVFLALPVALVALLPGLAGAQGATPRATGGPGVIRGRITEVGTGRAIASGSVTIRRGTDSTFVSGALPRPDGTFLVEGLQPGHYTVRVRSLGFAPLILVADITAAKPVVDLGSVVVSHVSAQQLAGQEIVAEREDVALAPDRNSYSTKNMTTASGGTAIDVLRNVPSVEVDGTNNVSLRGNANVVVQINGRSSPLKGDQLGAFLAQLPASAVKNVEVATNPSAKNDPEGTAGIINIVLNQEAELGLSGGVNVGTGTTGMANLSGNIGKQSGPLTMVLSGSFYRDRRLMTGTADRTNLITALPNFVRSTSDGSNEPLSTGLTLRSEYRLTKTDALSFDAFAYGGRYGGDNATYYTDLDGSGAVIGLFDQLNNRVSHNNSQDYTLAYRRTGAPTATTYSTELRYSNSGNTSDADLTGTVYEADPSTGAGTVPEHDYTVGSFPSWNVQGDYTHPFGAGSKIESGLKGTTRHTLNDFSAAYLDSASGAFVDAPSRASSFDYNERIGAAYAVYSQQLSKLQAQAGMRLEQASTTLDLPTVGQTVHNNYGSLFPSAILSYNLTEMRQAKVSYSRRISRPYPQQLSPIEVRDNSRSVFHGNPALHPEYTDALELGLQEARSWGSIQVNPYLRRTTNAVRFISLVDEQGITVSTFDNVALATTVGTDLNVNYHTGPVTIFTGGSAYHYASDARNIASTATGDLSTRATVWSVRANVTYKFDALTDAQFFGNYRAPQKTEGGSQDAFVFMNVGVRRKMWGDQGSISLRLSDPFNLMKFGSRTESISAIELSERHFGQRGVFITVSRNFGQQLKLRPRQDDTQQQPTTGAPVPGAP